MKTKNHLYFQYSNNSTQLLVSLTQYQSSFSSQEGPFFRVSVVVGELHNISNFDTLPEAMEFAEQKIRLMLVEFMVPSYLEALIPKDS